MDYVFEVIVGPEGPCLAVGDAKQEGFLTRIAGPKPWGGGKTVRRFVVSEQRLLDALGLKPETLSVGGPKARTTDPSTSKLAALRNRPRSGSQRRKLLDAITAADARGLTAEEAAAQTSIRLNSASTRMSELLRGGWIEEVGKRRVSSGEWAIVYIAREIRERLAHAA